MSITDSLIKAALEYFGITSKDADVIKEVIQQIDFDKNDDEIIISLKNGVTVKIEK